MKISGVCNNVSLLYAKTRQGVKDPSKTYYSLGLWFQDEMETGEVPCSSEIYLKVQEFANNSDKTVKLSTIYDFATEYNTDFKTFNLVSVTDIRKESNKKA